MRNTDLEEANLEWGGLWEVDLEGANLSCANCDGLGLMNANLRSANLSYARLRWAGFEKADMEGVNLYRADLSWAVLKRANLRNVDLMEATLWGANFEGSNLHGAKIFHAVVPSEGSFIAWKKLKLMDGTHIIAKIEIPEDAKRISCLSDLRCRADKVIPLSFYDIETGEELPKDIIAQSIFFPSTYKIGEVTKADEFCDDVRLNNAHGIYFFIMRGDAEQY